MSKVVNCRQVGVDCDFEARGETDQEVIQKCTEHARTAHGMKEMSREMMDKLRRGIRDEPTRKQHA